LYSVQKSYKSFSSYLYNTYRGVYPNIILNIFLQRNKRKKQKLFNTLKIKDNVLSLILQKERK